MVFEGGESNSFIRSSGIFNKGMVNRREKTSNRALEEDIVKLVTNWCRIPQYLLISECRRQKKDSI